MELEKDDWRDVVQSDILERILARLMASVANDRPKCILLESKAHADAVNSYEARHSHPCCMRNVRRMKFILLSCQSRAGQRETLIAGVQAECRM